jgi:hypothetical protein
MKAGIVLDDWKLPIFRKRLTAEGYRYEDGGSPSPGLTVLTVHFHDLGAMTEAVASAQAECQKQGKPS